jgi:hypothetical protein
MLFQAVSMKKPEISQEARGYRMKDDFHHQECGCQQGQVA